jgi:hypothetical protein
LQMGEGSAASSATAEASVLQRVRLMTSAFPIYR